MKIIKNKTDRLYIGLSFLLIGLILYSATIGRYSVDIEKVFLIIIDNVSEIKNSSWNTIEERIVELIRMPRILAAVIIGAGLSVSGVAAQGLFRNPLVDSGIIGVTSGAAFGGTLAILLFSNTYITLGLSFGFGMLSIIAVMMLSRVNGRVSILSLVLVGVVVSTFFGAAISIVKLVADPFSKLPAITYWLMGSLSAIGYKELLILCLTTGPAALIIYGLRYQLNVISMGESRAVSIGVPYSKIRWLLLISMALVSSGVVATAGAIGWVGLIIPHIARFFVGANHTKLIPISALIGGMFLLVIDDSARAISDAEIPIGIMTALIGVPLFAFILRKTQKNNGWAND